VDADLPEEAAVDADLPEETMPDMLDPAVPEFSLLDVVPMPSEPDA